MKRKNRSILNIVRNMLKTKKMLNEFLDETIYYVVYLSNKCHTKGLNDITPQKAWYGRKPSATHLKVFGSNGYMYIDDQVKTKLDYKSKKMIFMGYDKKSKGYKLYNPSEEKIVISRDVKFDQEKAWDMNVDDGEKYECLPILD